MLKLRYKPTGNIFTLPDEDAKTIYKSDEANYELIDYELPKEEVVKEKTVQELIMPEEQQEQNAITLEELEQMNRFELYGLAQKLELNPKSNANKATLLKLIKATGIFQ